MIEIGMGSVQVGECDVMGHMNVRHYVSRALEALAWLGFELGLGPAYARESNYLHVYVSQLRRKLEEEPSRPRLLLTVPGLGYRLVAPES